jgi:hypothetical protein
MAMFESVLDSLWHLNHFYLIGDLGLARLFYRPLQPLFQSDRVVVTIWYRGDSF